MEKQLQRKETISTAYSYPCSYLSIQQNEIPATPPTSSSLNECLKSPVDTRRDSPFRRSVFTADQCKTIDELYQDCEATYMTHAVARKLCTVRKPAAEARIPAEFVWGAACTQGNSSVTQDVSCHTLLCKSQCDGLNPEASKQTEHNSATPVASCRSASYRPNYIELSPKSTGAIQKAFNVMSDNDYVSFYPEDSTPAREAATADTASDDFKVYECDSVYFAADDVTSDAQSDVISDGKTAADRQESVPAYPAPSYPAPGYESKADECLYVNQTPNSPESTFEPEITYCAGMYTLEECNLTVDTNTYPAKKSNQRKTERQHSIPNYVAPQAPESLSTSSSICRPFPSPRPRRSSCDHVYVNGCTTEATIESVYLYEKLPL